MIFDNKIRATLCGTSEAGKDKSRYYNIINGCPQGKRVQCIESKKGKPSNKSLNATPKLWVELSPDSGSTVVAVADWARVNSMLCPSRIWLVAVKGKARYSTL